MKKVFILHHLGLGDHLMCNAIVRNLYTKYDRTFLFVYKPYVSTVMYMYRDLPNLKIISLEEDNLWYRETYVNSYMHVNPDAELIKIGYNYLNTSHLPADKAFYEQMGLPWEERYNGFYVKRDPIEEQKVFDYYNPDNEPFIFIHQDTSRPRLTLDLKHIKRKPTYYHISFTGGTKIIEIDFKPGEPKLFNFFHYMKLMEEAIESHYVDSSFKNLADSFIHDKKEMYFHKIEKIKNSTSTRNHWNIIDYN